MLGAYEDSDEDEAGDSQCSTANSQNCQPADIDSTLANFMAVSIIYCLSHALFWSMNLEKTFISNILSEVYF